MGYIVHIGGNVQFKQVVVYYECSVLGFMDVFGKCFGIVNVQDKTDNMLCSFGSGYALWS